MAPQTKAPKTVKLEDVKASIDALIALVREGTDVLIMDGDTPVVRMSPPASGERVPDLNSGTWMSDDFDDPLPDEFWLGEE